MRFDHYGHYRHYHANESQICGLRAAELRYRQWSSGVYIVNVLGELRCAAGSYLFSYSEGTDISRVAMLAAAIARAYLARYCELERADLAYAGVLDFEVIRDPRRLIDIPADTLGT